MKNRINYFYNEVKLMTYYFEIVVEVKKNGSTLLITHTDIRANNMLDALRFIMLQYIDKKNHTNFTRSVYSEMEISNTNYYCRSPLDFEIKSARCTEEEDDDDMKDYKSTVVRIDL